MTPQRADVRAEARRIMLTVRRHRDARRYGQSPHQAQVGCTLNCFRETPLRGDAIRYALHLEGIILMPDGTYRAGWMRPVK